MSAGAEYEEVRFVAAEAFPRISLQSLTGHLDVLCASQRVGVSELVLSEVVNDDFFIGLRKSDAYLGRSPYMQQRDRVAGAGVVDGPSHSGTRFKGSVDPDGDAL
jgi:hypothetical protein